MIVEKKEAKNPAQYSSLFQMFRSRLFVKKTCWKLPSFITFSLSLSASHHENNFLYFYRFLRKRRVCKYFSFIFRAMMSRRWEWLRSSGLFVSFLFDFLYCHLALSTPHRLSSLKKKTMQKKKKKRKFVKRKNSNRDVFWSCRTWFPRDWLWMHYEMSYNRQSMRFL